MRSLRRTIAAVMMAIACHGLFLFAVGSMAIALAGGMQLGIGSLPGKLGWLANLALILQFPLIHSALLTRGGRPWLERLSPVGYGRTLAISTYVAVGSLQLLATFWLWTPSGIIWHAPTWTPDWLFLTASWTAYCVLGPRLKEARWEGMFGDRFRAYQATVPFFLPRLRR